jgi:hypothetical protein
VSVAVTLRHWPRFQAASVTPSPNRPATAAALGITEAELARAIADDAEVEEGLGILLK